MKFGVLKTRIMTAFAGGQLLRNLKLTCHLELAEKLRQQIFRHPELVLLLFPKSFDFEKNVWFPTGSLSGSLSGSHETNAKEEILNSVLSTSKHSDPCFRMTQSLTLMERKAAFTLSCKTFSSDSSQAKLTQPPAQSSQTKFHSRAAHSYGFTLAETLIVLVILGIIASITIPALVKRHVEASNRTKIKKAMSVYDTALNKMVIENEIKSDTALSDWADSNAKNDCTNTSAYFKVARTLEVDGNSTNCNFRAHDGVFWNISDIKKPLIALREQDLNVETARSDTNRAFYMFGWFDENGSLRTNDLSKISATDKADLEKLYGFVAGRTKTSLSEIEDNDEINKENNGSDNSETPSCTVGARCQINNDTFGEYNDNCDCVKLSHSG